MGGRVLRRGAKKGLSRRQPRRQKYAFSRVRPPWRLGVHPIIVNCAGPGPGGGGPDDGMGDQGVLGGGLRGIQRGVQREGGGTGGRAK